MGKQAVAGGNVAVGTRVSVGIRDGVSVIAGSVGTPLGRLQASAIDRIKGNAIRR